MSDDYNESVYRNLAPLVKEDEGNKSGAKNSSCLLERTRFCFVFLVQI